MSNQIAVRCLLHQIDRFERFHDAAFGRIEGISRQLALEKTLSDALEGPILVGNGDGGRLVVASGGKVARMTNIESCTMLGRSVFLLSW
ncbi:hypothetical protein [uncultured Cohaesibacter sp.]|uniref:hypothetical protein n=1 Tax=uncultured Cohaesibacter sp. TaxID=1002546 RepID=UPI0029C70DEB|nr:hypothetical protein [uncultured Cohaesibacter sp.]